MNHTAKLGVLLAVLIAAPPAMCRLQVEGAEAPYKKVFALCIGVDEFESQSLENLVFAQNDAKAMYAILSETFGYEVMPPLLGRNATKAAIDSAVSELTARAGSNDAIVLYIAAHGTMAKRANGNSATEKAVRTDGYIIPYDGSVGNDQQVRSSCVAMRPLVHQLSQANVRHVLMIFDSCFSGFAADTRGGNYAAVEGARAFALMRHPSRIVLTAGTSKQEVLEHEEAEQGLMTHYLLRGLRTECVQGANHDQHIVTCSRLHDFVSEKVFEYAAKKNIEQLPIMRRIQGDGEFVFIPLRHLEDPEFRKGFVQHVASVEARSQPTGEHRGVTRNEDETAVSAKNDRPAAPRDPKRDEKEVSEAVERSRSGHDLSRDPTWQKRVEEYRIRASRGDPDAMASLSQCYLWGIGTPKSEHRAVGWAEESTVDGNERGRHLLGAFYAMGIGVQQDPSLARMLLPKDKKELAPWIDRGVAESLFGKPAPSGAPNTGSHPFPGIDIGGLGGGGGGSSLVNRIDAALSEAIDDCRSKKGEGNGFSAVYSRCDDIVDDAKNSAELREFAKDVKSRVKKTAFELKRSRINYETAAKRLEEVKQRITDMKKSEK